MGFKNDCEDDGAKSKWANLHFDALKRGLVRGPGRIFRSADADAGYRRAVSYTHLTLPTIYSV